MRSDAGAAFRCSSAPDNTSNSRALRTSSFIPDGFSAAPVPDDRRDFSIPAELVRPSVANVECESSRILLTMPECLVGFR